MIPPPDALPDDPATLKEIILAQRAEALRMAASVRAYEALIQALRIRIAKLKRQKFGSSSEKIGNRPIRTASLVRGRAPLGHVRRPLAGFAVAPAGSRRQSR